MDIRNLIFWLTVLHSAGLGHTADYYVDAGRGSDSNSGRSPAEAWKTFQPIQTEGLVPGDSVLFKRGEVWRERLIVPSSGSSGLPIVFSSYGEGDLPLLMGADVVSGFTLWAGTVYRTGLEYDPHQLFVDDNRLFEDHGAAGNVGPGFWDWASGFLYINIGSNPNSLLVETTRRDGSGFHGVLIQGKSHIVLEELRVSKFWVNVFVTGTSVGSSGIVVRNCQIEDAYTHGIHGYDDSVPNDDVLIENNTISGCGGSGVAWTRLANGGTIRQNEIFDNGQLSDEVTGDPEHVYSAGIALFGNKMGVRNVVVENNVVKRHGVPMAPVNTGGVGIWVDQTLGGNIVRYNTVLDNASNGIVAEDIPGGGKIYYNLVVGNGKGFVPFGGFGILVMRNSDGWEIYNNTLHDNAFGFGLGNWVGDGIPRGNQFGNNILFENGYREVQVVEGAENENNYFFHNIVEEKFESIRWGNSTSFHTIAAWEANASGAAWANLPSDPLFTDVQSRNYRPHSNSPCIDAGLDVGLTVDKEGAVVFPPPSIGTFENSYPSGGIFVDGFESGDSAAWSISKPD